MLRGLHYQINQPNDPDLAIVWTLGAGDDPQISKKDAAGERIQDAAVFEDGLS